MTSILRPGGLDGARKSRGAGLRPRSGVVATVLALVLACVGGLSGQAAASETWSIVPTQDMPGETNILTSLACISPSACIAVGTNENASGVENALSEAWNGTSWSLIPTPAPNPTVGNILYNVSCATIASCTAVGFQYSAPQVESPLIEHWNGSEWVLQTAALPPGSVENYLGAVACPTSTGCEAVGDSSATVGYNANQGDSTLAEIWNGSAWNVQTIPTPSGASPSSVQLPGLACTSLAFCLAIGTYSPSGGPSNLTSFSELWDGTNWSLEPTAVAPNGTQYALDAVNCTTETSCTAVGWSYVFSTKSYAPLVESWNGTSWTLPSQPPGFPTGATYGLLAGIGCGSVTSCTAVGYYMLNNVTYTWAAVWNGSSWNVESMPFIAGDYGMQLQGVACDNQAQCLAVGYSSGPTGIFALSEVATIVSSTATTVSSSIDPSTYGQSVTFTATVSPSDGGGTVAFYADGSTIPITGCSSATLSLVSGVYQASCATSLLGAGTHTVTATYSGDSAYLTSSGDLSGGQQVHPTPLSVTAPSSTISYGSRIPQLDPSYSGFVNGDTATSLSSQATCTTTATSTSPGGTYPVTCSGAVDPNYTFSYVPGMLTIDQSPSFTAPTPPLTATARTIYSYTFTTSGFPAPTFSLGGGAPSWLSINPTTGTVTGTAPSHPQTFTYSVIATNSVGSVTAGPFTVALRHGKGHHYGEDL